MWLFAGSTGVNSFETKFLESKTCGKFALKTAEMYQNRNINYEGENRRMIVTGTVKQK